MNAKACSLFSPVIVGYANGYGRGFCLEGSSLGFDLVLVDFASDEEHRSRLVAEAEAIRKW